MSEIMPRVIYIMGPPGAGKGTQTMLLAPEIGYQQFSTGDAFRRIAREDSVLGKKVKDIMENGYLAPPELAAEVVIAAVKDHLDKGDNLIFDGTPRTKPEADLVDDFFLKNNYGRPLVIYLDSDKETMVERNGKRMFCLNVSPDFPIIFRRDEKKCSDLGGTLGRRADDDPSKFDIRWDQFLELTKPVIDSYKEEGILQIIDGRHPIRDVHKSIVTRINELYHTNYKHDFSED